MYVFFIILSTECLNITLFGRNKDLTIMLNFNLFLNKDENIILNISLLSITLLLTELKIYYTLGFVKELLI